MWRVERLFVVGCQGDDGDKQQVGGGETDAADAAADADEPTAGTTH